MRTDKVRAYWLEMWKKHKPGEKIQDDEYFDLTNFTNTDTGIDRYSTLFAFLEEIREELQTSVFVGPNDQKTLSVLEWEKSEDDNIIEGVFAKGRKGRRADHLPVEEAQEPHVTPDEVREPDARDEDTAAEERYHFLIYIPPENPRKALLMMHSHGVGGVITLLRHKLRKKLTRIDTDIKYRTKNIAGEKVINKLEDEPILGFELIKKGVSTQEHLSLSNDLGSGVEESKVRVDIRATSGDQWQLSRGQLERLSGRDDFDYGEILPEDPDSDASFDPDKVKVKVERNGRPRKVDLSKDRATVEVELLPTQLDYHNGRLSMNSVGKEARRIANETLDQEGYSLLDAEESLINDDRTDE